MMASPRPLRAATTGSSTGSAYGATNRTTRCAARTRRGQPAAVGDDVGRDLALDAEADGGVGAHADGEREHEQEQLRAPRRRRCTNSMIIPVWLMASRSRIGEPVGLVVAVVRLPAATGWPASRCDGLLGVVEAVGVDAVADRRAS